MASIKNTSNALGNLLSQLQSPPSGGASSFSSNFGGGAPQNNGIGIDDDSIPSNMLETAPVFEMNYKSTKKQCVKKAKEQLRIIVKEVVPTMLQNSPMIVDKINQDAEQLGNLYYEYEKTDRIVIALMETIARGETQSRLFEVYGKMSKEMRDLSNLVTNTQNSMRKYYIDTYLDLQQKDEADEAAIVHKGQKELPPQPQEETIVPMVDTPANVVVGTEQTIKLINEKKRLAMKAKFSEDKDKK